MFILSQEEAKNSRSQFATLKRGKNIKYLPYAFTEHGVAMLSSVLNSERAIQVNILIIKAFVRLRHLTATHKELADKFQELETRVSSHDSAIVQIIDEINRILNPARVEAIGFKMGGVGISR